MCVLSRFMLQWWRAPTAVTSMDMCGRFGRTYVVERLGRNEGLMGGVGALFMKWGGRAAEHRSSLQ